MIGATKTGIPLEWGTNQRGGKAHTEWHAQCGCAFHPNPAPHWHPCQHHATAGTWWEGIARQAQLERDAAYEAMRDAQYRLEQALRGAEQAT